MVEGGGDTTFPNPSLHRNFGGCCFARRMHITIVVVSAQKQIFLAVGNKECIVEMPGFVLLSMVTDVRVDASILRYLRLLIYLKY